MILLMTIFYLIGTEAVAPKVMTAMDGVVSRIVAAESMTVNRRGFGQWQIRLWVAVDKDMVLGDKIVEGVKKS